MTDYCSNRLISEAYRRMCENNGDGYNHDDDYTDEYVREVYGVAKEIEYKIYEFAHEHEEHDGYPRCYYHNWYPLNEKRTRFNCLRKDDHLYIETDRPVEVKELGKSLSYMPDCWEKIEKAILASGAMYVVQKRHIPGMHLVYNFSKTVRVPIQLKIEANANIVIAKGYRFFYNDGDDIEVDNYIGTVYRPDPIYAESKTVHF